MVSIVNTTKIETTETDFQSDVYPSFSEYLSDMEVLGYDTNAVAVHSVKLAEAKERMDRHVAGGGTDMFLVSND